MSINFGPIRASVHRDPSASSFTPADRRDPAPPAAMPRSTTPSTRSAPLKPEAYGPVDNRFAHLARKSPQQDANERLRLDRRSDSTTPADRTPSSDPGAASLNRALREGSSAQATNPVNLDEAQQQQLAQRYAPIRYLHPDEKNEPGNPQTFIDNATVVRGGNKVRLDIPDDQRAGNAQDAPTFYKYDAQTRTMTYWYFYPNNDAPGPWFDHEGDWERVEVQFDRNLEPTAARYSNHETHNTYAWDKLEKEDGRPVVYVAKGTHANNAYEGKRAPPGTPAIGGRDEFAKSDRRIDSASDLHALDDQPWTNQKLEDRFGVDKVLWGGTQKSDAGVVVGRTRVGLPGFGVDTTYVHGDSPDGPDRPPYAAADVDGLAEDVLLVGEEKWSGDDDHARLTALSGELLAAKDDPYRRARLIGALLEQDGGAFDSWLKTGIADDLVDDGRITPEQRELIRESVAAAIDEGLFSSSDETPGGW